jgi:hypothetical protein
MVDPGTLGDDNVKAIDAFYNSDIDANKACRLRAEHSISENLAWSRQVFTR